MGLSACQSQADTMGGLLQAMAPWTLQHAPVARPPPDGRQFMPLEVLQQYAAQSGLQLSPMQAPLGSPWQQQHLPAGPAFQQQARHQGYQVGQAQGSQWLAGSVTPHGRCSRAADNSVSFRSPAASAPQSYAQGTREEGGLQAHGTPSSLAEPRPSPVAWDITSAHQQQCEAGASHQRGSGVRHAAGMQGTRADLHDSADTQEGQLQEHFELRETAAGLVGGRLSELQQDGGEAQQGAGTMQEEALPASDGDMSPSLPQRQSSPAVLSGTTRQARALARTLTQATPAEGGTGVPLHTGQATAVLCMFAEKSATEVQQPSQGACMVCAAPLHLLE